MKTRNTNLPQHHYDQGHFGELPLLSLPTSGSNVLGHVFRYSGSNWTFDWPLNVREDGASEGQVYVLNFVGDISLTVASGVGTVSATGGASVATANFVIDGGGSSITTGIKGDLHFDFGCTINAVTLLADQTGSIVVDIWKDTYANFPPTDADSITASAPPTISTANKSQDTTLTGWTTTINSGDVLRFNVDSITTLTRVTLALKVTRT